MDVLVELLGLVVVLVVVVVVLALLVVVVEEEEEFASGALTNHSRMNRKLWELCSSLIWPLRPLIRCELARACQPGADSEEGTVLVLAP